MQVVFANRDVKFIVEFIRVYQAQSERTLHHRLLGPSLYASLYASILMFLFC